MGSLYGSPSMLTAYVMNLLNTRVPIYDVWSLCLVLFLQIRTQEDLLLFFAKLQGYLMFLGIHINDFIRVLLEAQVPSFSELKRLVEW